jgi:hypothetical protein
MSINRDFAGAFFALRLQNGLKEWSADMSNPRDFATTLFKGMNFQYRYVF